MKWAKELENWRIRSGNYGSPVGALYGAFDLPGPCGMRLHVLADDGTETGWEHVSVSGRRIPNWEEMCFVKNLFWNDDEVVVQYHPRKADYMNFHPRCLHLWKCKNIEFPTPPRELVAPLSLDVLHVLPPVQSKP